VFTKVCVCEVGEDEILLIPSRLHGRGVRVDSDSTNTEFSCGVFFKLELLFSAKHEKRAAETAEAAGRRASKEKDKLLNLCVGGGGS